MVSLMLTPHEAQVVVTEAFALLVKCWTVGHRDGWQDGQTSAEVFDEVNDFLSEHLGDDWIDKFTK